MPRTAPDLTVAATRDREGSSVFFNGEVVRYANAKVASSLMGSTTMGVFEGIRAYRNTEREQLFALAMPQHYERMHQNTRLLQTSILWDGDELMAITTDLLRRKEYREDTYVRPLSFKSAEIISANCKMPRTVSRLRPLQ